MEKNIGSFQKFTQVKMLIIPAVPHIMHVELLIYVNPESACLLLILIIFMPRILFVWFKVSVFKNNVRTKNDGMHCALTAYGRNKDLTHVSVGRVRNGFSLSDRLTIRPRSS